MYVYIYIYIYAYVHLEVQMTQSFWHLMATLRVANKYHIPAIAALLDLPNLGDVLQVPESSSAEQFPLNPTHLLQPSSRAVINIHLHE